MSGFRRSFEDAIVSEHAREQLVERRIDRSILDEVLRSPESVAAVRTGRVVAQKIVGFGADARPYLVRVFIDIDRNPPEVVTAYRTSKLRKYTGEL